MKRLIIVGVAVILALVAGAFLPYREPIVHQPHVDFTGTSSGVEAPTAQTIPTTPIVETTPKVEAPAAQVAAAISSPPEVPAGSPFRRLSTDNVGYVRKMTTVDFNRYLVFMGLGAAIDQNNPSYAAITRQRYELTEEEFVEVTKYSVEALAADRLYQAEGRRHICERRSSIKTLHDLGTALNDLERGVEANQELLGREAEAALGAATFSKINNSLLREPPREVTVGDFPILFAARGSDLTVELDRLCNNVR